LAGDTIVVFTSDHGEMLGSQGRIQKFVPYAESVNIPLIMRWPGRIVPGPRSTPCKLPLIIFLHYADWQACPFPRGRRFGFEWSRHRQGERPSRGTSHGTLQLGELWSRPQHLARMARCQDQAIYLFPLGHRAEELYDNLADPYQMANLAENGAEPESLVQLRARLSELLAVAHDDFRPGTDYRDWYDNCRNLVRTALGQCRLREVPRLQSHRERVPAVLMRTGRSCPAARFHRGTGRHTVSTEYAQCKASESHGNHSSNPWMRAAASMLEHSSAVGRSGRQSSSFLPSPPSTASAHGPMAFTL